MPRSIKYFFVKTEMETCDKLLNSSSVFIYFILEILLD